MYFAIPNRFRWILLLLASYYFYMCWNYKYIVLIMFSTVVDYTSGILMHRSEKKAFRKLLLTASLITNLGLLFFFKYFTFFGDTVNFFFDKRINAGMSKRDIEHLLALYDGEIAWTDLHVGKIIDDLRETGLLDRTVVAVTSDHGTEFFEHGQKGHRNTHDFKRR